MLAKTPADAVEQQKLLPKLLAFLDPLTFLLRLLWEGVPTVVMTSLGFWAAYRAFTGIHWAYAVLAAIVVGTLGWYVTRILLSGLTRVWPHIRLDDHLLRKDVKALSTSGLDREEQHYALKRAQHSPKFGEERCSICGVRSPARCRELLDADRYHYALRTERRFREDLARRG